MTLVSTALQNGQCMAGLYPATGGRLAGQRPSGEWLRTRLENTEVVAIGVRSSPTTTRDFMEDAESLQVFNRTCNRRSGNSEPLGRSGDGHERPFLDELVNTQCRPSGTSQTLNPSPVALEQYAIGALRFKRPKKERLRAFRSRKRTDILTYVLFLAAGSGAWASTGKALITPKAWAKAATGCASIPSRASRGRFARGRIA